MARPTSPGAEDPTACPGRPRPGQARSSRAFHRVPRKRGSLNFHIIQNPFPQNEHDTLLTGQHTSLFANWPRVPRGELVPLTHPPAEGAGGGGEPASPHTPRLIFPGLALRPLNREHGRRFPRWFRARVSVIFIFATRSTYFASV